MGKNTGLVVLGIAAAVLLLPDLLNRGEEGTTESGGYSWGNLPSLGDLTGGLLGGGEGGGGGDILGGLTGGLGDLFSGLAGGLYNMFGSLGGGLQNVFSGLKLPDMSNILPDLSNILPSFTEGVQGGEQGGQAGITGQSGIQGEGPYPPSYPNTIPNIFYSAGSFADALGKTALIGGGVWAGSKVLGPVLPKVGTWASGLFRSVPKLPAVDITGGGLGIMNLLRTPVSASPLGLTIGASAVSFGLGYGAGTLFNKTPPGKWLIEQSGNLGEKFGGTAFGSSLFGAAQLKTDLTDRAFKSTGYSTSDVYNWFKSGMSTAEVRQKLGIGASSIKTSVNNTSPVIVNWTAAQKAAYKNAFTNITPRKPKYTQQMSSESSKQKAEQIYDLSKKYKVDLRGW